MNPSPQPPGAAAPPLGSNRRLHDQLRQELASLLKRTEAASQTELRAATQLKERIEDKIRATRHVYGVFAVGAGGRRRMVLRDVAELDGKKPLCTTDNFAEAIQIAGEVLDDPVRHSHPPVNVGELTRTLTRSAREIQQIIDGNNRLKGDGTTAAPYARMDGKPLPMRAPITLGFAGVIPAQLELRVQDRHLVLSKKSSPT